MQMGFSIDTDIKEVGFGKKYWIKSPQDTRNAGILFRCQIFRF
jgi:hypothetical protein